MLCIIKYDLTQSNYKGIRDQRYTYVYMDKVIIDRYNAIKQLETSFSETTLAFAFLFSGPGF